MAIDPPVAPVAPPKPAPPQPPQLQSSCLPFWPEYNPPASQDEQENYIAAATTGRITPMINGRNANGTGADINVTEAFDDMQKVVSACSKGDKVYMTAWHFDPAVKLTAKSNLPVTTWGQLFKLQAGKGVEIKILITNFSRLAPFAKQARDAGVELDKIIATLSKDVRSNLQYLISMHPVTLYNISIATHHQKFMVVRKGSETLAWCGGLDIAPLRTPADWSNANTASWHDVHLKAEGLIALDLAREFVLRWNKEKDHPSIKPGVYWGGYYSIPAWQPGGVDAAGDRNNHRVQMHRTISIDWSKRDPPQQTKRFDIWLAYLSIISCTKRFLYLENQYFREPLLANHIVAHAQKTPELLVIIVAPEKLDEGDGDPFTRHGNYLQHIFFTILQAGLGNRLRVYNMFGRFIHAKIIMGDDRLFSAGSANANRRGFLLDSELNLNMADETLVQGFRHRLWAHNLGVKAADVAQWSIADFFAKWDAVALANSTLIQAAKTQADLEKAIGNLAGEGVVAFDMSKNKGKKMNLLDLLRHWGPDIRLPDWNIFDLPNTTDLLCDLAPDTHTEDGTAIA